MKRISKLNTEHKEFYRKVFALVIPMALQNLINVGVTATDVVMLGKVGETSLSASSLAGQVQFILTLFIFGLGSGAAVLTSQYWGKRDFTSIEKIMAMAMRITLIISILFTLCAFCIPSHLLRLFTSETALIEEGTVYLRIIGFSYIIASLTTIYLNVLRSVERVMISTIVYLISLIVNIILNSIFIFGLFGFPALGIAGAALGTVCARFVELIVIVIYTKKVKLPIHLTMKRLLSHDPLLFKDFLRYASPVVVNELFWGIAVSVNTSIMGHLGSAVIAANSITQVLRQLAMVVTFGLANATAIMVGKAIGEGNMDNAKIYARRLLRLSVLFGTIGAILILCVHPIIVSTMSLSELAKDYFAMMIWVMSYFCIGQAINTTLVVGVFRGGGDTKFGLFLDVSTMWGGSLLFGALAAFVFHAPVTIVYMILMSDEIIKIPITFIHYRRGKWAQNITR